MEMIQEILTTLAVSAVSCMCAYGIALVRKTIAKANAQIAKMESEEKRNLLANALTDLEHLAIITVSAIEQTTAKGLRKAVADGTVDASELKKLSLEAEKKVSALLRDEYKEAINENYGDLSTYIKDCIEAAVLSVKKQS